MKRVIYFLTAAVMTVMMTGCTTSKSTVSSRTNLKNYEYASVINNDTYHIPASLMEYEIKLFDAVEASGLQLVGDQRIYALTPEQQSKLLLVKYGVQDGGNEAIVIVNFIDYLTGRPVVSCRGAYGLGIDNEADIRGAIKRVEKQIYNTFR